MSFVLGACTSQTSTVQTTEKGTQWEWQNGTIVVKTPERPAGQKSVLGLTTPKLEAVRVGFVGLGMRGPGAVERFTYIPGTQVLERRKEMYFGRLNEQNVEQYIDYLKLAMQQEPDMMTVEEIDEEGIRTRLRDSFYEKSTSILAMENNQVAGRIEYHFYGCIQDGYRMAS